MIKTLFLLAIFANTHSTITFKSEWALREALYPLTLEEVNQRINQSTASVRLEFQYDSNLETQKVIPLRNPGTGHLLTQPVYTTPGQTLTVFYPENPRVPHQLAIAFNREIKSLAEVSQEENADLYVTIKKIAEIYKTCSIQGFVIAQFATPQTGHQERVVVEVIPHLPRFGSIKNIVEKIDCNRYLLFREANLSPIKYAMSQEAIAEHTQFWESALAKVHGPLNERDTKLHFPYTRQESHQLESEQILFEHLVNIFEDKGGQSDSLPLEAYMPTELPEAVKSVTSEACAFCKPEVIDRQLVCEYEGISVFYNTRKWVQPGSCFLILPKRHFAKVYDLTPEEIDKIYVVRKALLEVLNEKYPHYKVVVYTQDDPSTGQTVFHTHDQVFAFDPETIALTWTMMSLYPSGCVSDKEIEEVLAEFGSLLRKKLYGESWLQKRT